MQFKLEDSVPHGAVIKVVGVGGGGGNAVDHMVRSNVEGVDDHCGIPLGPYKPSLQIG